MQTEKINIPRILGYQGPKIPIEEKLRALEQVQPIGIIQDLTQMGLIDKQGANGLFNTYVGFWNEDRLTAKERLDNLVANNYLR